MKTKSLLVLVSLMPILAINAQSSGGERPVGALPNQLNYQPLEKFSDDFEGGNLDSDVWKNNPNLSTGAWIWSDRNAVVKNGKLQITVTREDDTLENFPTKNCGQITRDFYFKSGAVATTRTRTYGYYEARMKGVKIFPGMSPAFWLYSNPGRPSEALSFDYAANGYNSDNTLDLDKFPDRRLPDGPASIQYCEIDIVEAQQGDYEDGRLDGENVTDHNLHAFVQYPGEGRRQLRPKPYPSQLRIRRENPKSFSPSDYHTYAVENRKDSIVWYLDGNRIGAKLNTTWHLPMRMIFSMGMRRWFINYNDECIGNGPAKPYFTNPREDSNAQFITEEAWSAEDATMEIEYVKSWQIGPSVYLKQEDFNAVTSKMHTDKINLNINYHGGSVQQVIDDPQFNGVSLSLGLRRKGQDGLINANVGNKRVSDSSTLLGAKQYGGVSTLSLDISGVTPSSQLEPDEFYVLIPAFRSSNSTLVTEKRQIPITIGDVNIKTLSVGGVGTDTSKIGNNDQTLDKTQFSVYPNPAKDYVTITLNKNVTGKSRVSLFDITGKKIYEKKIKHSKITLDTKSLNGLFLLKIQNGEKVISDKLIIQ